MKNKIELLMPAGDLLRLKTALLYGADAVFIGGKKFSLRAKASNFSISDIKEGVEFAHKLGKKVYVTVNIIPHYNDLFEIEKYLKELDEIKVDAIIVSSLYIISLVKILKLNLECHVSTQMSSTNSEHLQFYKELGCERVVLARECTIAEIKKMREKNDIELEVFIQGGLCSSVSGKCTLSNYFVLRDANRGGCAHSCRWDYYLFDNEKNIIEENHPFKIASKDLMGIRHVKELIDANVSSLKVEGRMKSVNYIALVARSYRKIIDACYSNQINEELIENEIRELKKIENRPLCEGFLNELGISNFDQIYDNESKMVNQTYLGYIEKYENGIATIVRKNDICINQKVEVICYDKDAFEITIDNLFDENGPVVLANKTENKLFFKTNIEFKPFYLIRSINNNE